MSNKLTLVTGLFNIGRGEMDTDFRRSFDHYIECFERLLKLDFPMVIYIEAENEHIIWKHRKRENTSVVIKTLDDVRRFPFFDKIQEIRTNPNWSAQAGWLENSTQAKLELYNPVVMSKQFMLNDASLFNNFGSKYYMWIDAGLSNTVNIEQYFNADFEKRITPHLNKMLYIAFPYDGQVEVHGFPKHAMNRYAGKDTEYVCRGGLFGGTKAAINEINDIYYHMLNDTLNNGYMGTEESIFTLISYQHPKKVNVRMIDGNGLIVKFLTDLHQGTLESEPEFPLAFYTLTYNIPKQFEMWAESFLKAYPEEFTTVKKYVIDNSTDPDVAQEYAQLFAKYNFEVFKFDNIGINDGRQFAAEHFDKSDHKYMVFFEDDMLLFEDNTTRCVNGFTTWHANLFKKCMEIVDEEDLDYLKLVFSEFYGNNHNNWGFKNVPSSVRETIFPDNGDADKRWKTKIEYTASLQGLPYAVGHYHYCNWPIMFTKRGNKKIFLDDKYEHLYEQNWMSLAAQFQHDGSLKAACLLATPVNHYRKWHYDGTKRRENRHYKD